MVTVDVEESELEEVTNFIRARREARERHDKIRSTALRITMVASRVLGQLVPIDANLFSGLRLDGYLTADETDIARAVYEVANTALVLSRDKVDFGK